MSKSNASSHTGSNVFFFYQFIAKQQHYWKSIMINIGDWFSYFWCYAEPCFILQNLFTLLITYTQEQIKLLEFLKSQMDHWMKCLDQQESNFDKPSPKTENVNNQKSKARKKKNKKQKTIIYRDSKFANDTRFCFTRFSSEIERIQRQYDRA
jgi:hypothetical protein